MAIDNIIKYEDLLFVDFFPKKKLDTQCVAN